MPWSLQGLYALSIQHKDLSISVMVSLPSVHAHHNFILDCFRDYVFTASFVPLLFVVLLIIHELSAHCLHNVTSNCWVFVLLLHNLWLA